MSTVERSGRALEVDGRPVGLTVEGDGEPLVLLHGIGRDRRDWAAVLPTLARSFRCYAVDVEGFGESVPRGAAVTLGSMARMVRDVLDAVGEDRPLRVVGNSMGGAVAMRMVADDPAASPGGAAQPGRVRREAALGLRLLTAPALGPLLLRAASWPVAARLQAALDRSAPEMRELAFASAERLRVATARLAYLQVIHDLGAWGGIRVEWREAVLHALADSGIPVLVLWGDRDTVLPHTHLDAVTEAVPHAVARSLPGVGHMPQLEDPVRTADEIAAFLAEAPQR